VSLAAPQLGNITIVRQNILLREGQTYVWGRGSKYTKCNKINNNSANFRVGAKLPLGRNLSPGPLVAGLVLRQGTQREASLSLRVK